MDLSLGLREIEDEEAMYKFRDENRKKSTVDLSLGLGRVNSIEEGEYRIPGNPMLKVGLEKATEEDLQKEDANSDEQMMSMSDMMAALGRGNSLEGESWERKVDSK